VQLLPESASEERVELCSCFWARLADRAKTWSDVMRCLTTEQQVRCTLHCVAGCRSRPTCACVITMQVVDEAHQGLCLH
jgi:hypothetical protein